MFIIGAGWRSGTTALQRLVAGGGEVAVWGEPYTDALPLPRLLRIVTDAEGSPMTRRHVIDGAYEAAGLAQRWIANLYPPRDALISAVRGFVAGLYWDPVSNVPGIRTFGVKEVALLPDHLELLGMAFPEARWVLVVRDPAVAYRSYRTFARGAAFSPRRRRPAGGGQAGSCRAPHRRTDCRPGLGRRRAHPPRWARMGETAQR